NSHLDTQWNWDAKTTINEYVKNTLYDNIKLMDKYPNYVFNYESAIKYRWMKEYYPSEYAKLQTYINRGQWHVSGMSVDANDVMVSSAENILRNWLYGNQFFKREFGVRGGYDIMLPDCFGFGFALPSLAHHAGFRGFHSQKLSWGNAAYDNLPAYGRWQGVDGSIIYAIHKPGPYDAHEEFNCDLTESSEILNKINDVQKKTNIPMKVSYVGPRGDRGGALQDNPDKEGEDTPYWLSYSAGKKGGKVNVILATPDSIFRYLDSHGGDNLPLWKSELPMRSHGVGSYTSKGALKRWNRSNELTADAAEKASSVAQWLGARPYPQESLNEAWFRTLWQNHHDGITGTSIPKADEISYNEYYLANKVFAKELTTSVGAVAQYMDTRVEGTPVVVYNPLSWTRTDVVEGSIACTEKPEGICVFGPDKQEVLAQITSYDEKNDVLHFIFAAEVPALGYAVYDVRTDKACSLTSALTVDTEQQQISNGHYRVKIANTGDISSVYDEQKSRTLMNTTKTQFLKDEQLVWEAWEVSYEDLVRTPKGTLGSGAEITLAEDGPLRKAYRIKRQKDGSTFLQYIRMTALSDRIDCVNEVDWQTQETLVKVLFPFTFNNSKDTYDLSLGTIQRGVRTTNEYEVLGHQWADHSAGTNSYGVSILTNCKYGWDKPSEKQLRLTLHHTPYARDHKHHADMDIGANHYTYSIYPHDGGWGVGTQQEASRLNQPLVAFTAPKHDGELGRTFHFIDIDYDGVSVKALKKAEESDELIVRVFEWAGKDGGNVTMKFPAAITSAREVNALEETIGTATVTDGALQFAINHYQPKTFAIRLAKPSLTKVETRNDIPVALTHNVDMMSYDSNIT
ncbi:MAG: alpha-mannosidase, partial [Bacteroidaceae bacterium]|nr:alpha-mannosidase [Bacteroidaceae bacterium]